MASLKEIAAIGNSMNDQAHQSKITFSGDAAGAGQPPLQQ
jgi:hypothetical protein